MECDYPHSDSTWPEAPEVVMKSFRAVGVPDEDIHKITWENSCRHFDYDPFKHIDRRDSTVGALRAQAGDVDTSTKSRAEWRKLYEARETAAHAVG